MVTRMTKRGDPEWAGAEQPLCYVVTDIETDGPEPGRNSMRSFASVAVDEAGRLFDRFEGCLAPLEGAEPDPGTLAWLQAQPGAWDDLTRDPRPAAEVMQAYTGWLRALPAEAVFVAHPLIFDGFWIDWYLRRFLGLRLGCGPYGGERLFLGGGIDLSSLLMGATGWRYDRSRRDFCPESWFGNHVHTHRAIDDASGYAHMLAEVLKLSRKRIEPQP